MTGFGNWTPNCVITSISTPIASRIGNGPCE
nr:MAG TPA: hypothetical protein [Caudoviricetes sp.]